MPTLRGGIFPRLIAMMPLLFPLYLIRGSAFGVPVTLPEVILGFTFLYFIYRERAWETPRIFLVWPVIIFVAAAVLSTVIVPQLSYFVDGSEFHGLMNALGILKGWILAPVIYFFMARFYFQEKPSLIETSLRALLTSGVLLSTSALYQVWTGDFSTPDLRASGPFESANYLALYLGPIFVYGVLSSIKEEDGFEKILLIFATLICGGALFFTKSYASWIAVSVTLLISFLLFLRKQAPHFRLAGIFVILVGLAVVFYSQADTEKFKQFFDFTNRSSSGVRVQIYTIAWDLIKQHPILGIGLGQFEQVYQTQAVSILGTAPFEWVMLHPHNLYFALWLNTGLLGLASLMYFIWNAIKWIFEDDTKQRPVAAMMLLVILIHGIFDTPVFKNDLAFEFWLLLAML
ncbi:MAG: O-antigen ligase family protein [Patescibacteria group bacterium]